MFFFKSCRPKCLNSIPRFIKLRNLNINRGNRGNVNQIDLQYKRNNIVYRNENSSGIIESLRDRVNRYYCTSTTPVNSDQDIQSEEPKPKEQYNRVSLKSIVNKPVIAIIGKPNVGKSTLFNRVIKGQRQALVEEIPGTTRDRYYGEGFLFGREFILIDTGGLVGESKEQMEKDKFSKMIRDQAEVAMDEADIILFLLDYKSGITTVDKDIARMLRVRKTNGKPVYIGVNKADNSDMRTEGFDQLFKDQLVRLGLGTDSVPFSSIHGEGVMDLFENLLKPLPYADLNFEKDFELGPIRISIVGQPNAGKSSLLNKIIEEERSIVSEIPGTTHDPVDCLFKWRNDHEIMLIDTAGIRRRSTHKEGLERSSVLWALKSVERSHVVLMVIDATIGVTEQDLKIASFIVESKKSVILLVNKWDLYLKNQKTQDTLFDQINFYDLQKKGQYVQSKGSFSEGNLSKDYTYKTLLDEMLQVNKQSTKTNDHEKFQNLKKTTKLAKEKSEKRHKELIKQQEEELEEDDLEEDEDRDLEIKNEEDKEIQKNSSEMEYDKIIIGEKDGVDLDLDDEDFDLGFDIDDLYRDEEEESVGAGKPENPDEIFHKKLQEYIKKKEEIQQNQDKERVKRVPPPPVDLPKYTSEQKQFEKKLRDKLSFIDYVPVIFTSAKTGYCIPTAMDLAIKVFFEREKKLKVNTLIDLIKQATFKHKIPARGKNNFKLKFAAQAKGYPPQFVFFVNDPDKVDPTFAKYLLRCIREVYPFTGTPIHIHFRKNKSKKKINYKHRSGRK
ncbi:GTP-binding protein [Tieghemostelium lacteum]|uniref:GTPase Der n=1 Tax=Tieghemostelium lacteum TaxID=361077 RepID=A0A152A1M7_TIELA|nr:GTP-binding protein [Tieghemostelium lacteum]|eukprot:KYR00152.1 GTP-binding protein [Tieghemostelium lacteum]